MKIKHVSEYYKTNPWLQIYASGPEEEGLVVEDFFHKRRFLLDNEIFFHVLNYCNTFKKNEDILRYLKREKHISTGDARTLIQELVLKNLLVMHSSPAYAAEKKSFLWKSYGWEDALDYFIAIKDYPFLDYESSEAKYIDNGLMDTYIKKDPVPPIYKNYKGSKKIFLQKNLTSFDAIDIRPLLKEKVFDDATTDKSLTKKQLTDIIFYTFGEVGKVEFPLQGEFSLKTSPSGGARHPIEAYIISFNTAFPQGIYHYSVQKHALEQIVPEVSVQDLYSSIYELHTGPQFPVKAVVVFSAVVPRSMWRYREPRSYRVILHDLGHVLETMKIVSKAVGVKTYYGHGFHDGKLLQLLGINDDNEIALKFAALG